MKWLTTQGARRGIHTSEFLVFVLFVVADVSTAMADLQTTGHAITWGAVAATAYISARGMTKQGVGASEDPLFTRDKNQP